MVKVVSLDDMHSENIWFSGSKPSNYNGMFRCHSRDTHMDRRTEESGKYCSVLLDQKPQFLFEMVQKGPTRRLGRICCIICQVKFVRTVMTPIARNQCIYLQLKPT